MHKLLSRQLTKAFGSLEAVPADVLSFCEKVVSPSYESTDEDRRFMERSLEISSAELRAANAQLLESAQEQKGRVATLIESMGDGVMATDMSGRIVLWNQMASSISGWSSADAMGKHYLEVLKLVTEHERADCTAFIQEAFASRKVSSMQTHTVLVRRDGTDVPVSDSVAPIIDERGRMSGVIMVFRDATKERELEHAKEEFVSVASHQMRTPLTAVKGCVSILLDQDLGPLNDKQVEFLLDIQGSNNRMITLVNSLLNVSRIDLGVFAVDPVPTDLGVLGKSVADELAIEAKESGISLVTDADPSLGRINVDPELTRMVFQNLLQNGVKYTRKGGMVRLSLRRTPEGDAQIVVSDDGIGIPSRQQEKIFGKMFRADNARKIDPNGSGLGLYIIKAILDTTGGSIAFESAEGKGSTFTVTIPGSGMRRRQGDKRLQ